MPQIADIPWQPLIAYGLVILAAAWILRRMWRVVRRAMRGGGSAPGETTGSCASCPQNTGGVGPAKVKPLVQLESKHRDSKLTPK